MTTQTQPLPDLASDYPLSETQRNAYRQDGHILLRNVASRDEVAAYHPVINDAAMRYNREKRALGERDTYGKAFLQIINLWTKDDAVRRFTLARRFAKIAAELMGVSGVRIYHDQALFKEAGGGLTPWHQDQHYWPLDTDNTITLWMPLVDASAAMGTLRFASGSHAQGYLGDLPISDKSEATLQQFVQDNGYALTESGAMQAGDATFHSGWTLHSAAGNSSDTMREVMTVIYFADGARATEPDNENRQRDLEQWLPGVEPGDLAAGPLNPLAYSSQTSADPTFR